MIWGRNDPDSMDHMVIAVVNTKLFINKKICIKSRGTAALTLVSHIGLLFRNLHVHVHADIPNVLTTVSHPSYWFLIDQF